MSNKWQSGFGHFSAFFELWTVFWAVFRYPSGKLKKNKNPNIDIWVPKMRFFKMYIFGVGGAWYGIFLIREKSALRAGLIKAIHVLNGPGHFKPSKYCKVDLLPVLQTKQSPWFSKARDRLPLRAAIDKP